MSQLFPNTEVWNDYRRTCYPNLAPASDSFIPARLVYGTDERRANPNIPSPSQRPKRNQLDPATPTAIDGTTCLGTGSRADEHCARSVGASTTLYGAALDRSVEGRSARLAARPSLGRTSQIRSRRVGPEAILHQDWSARRSS